MLLCWLQHSHSCARLVEKLLFSWRLVGGEKERWCVCGVGMVVWREERRRRAEEEEDEEGK